MDLVTVNAKSFIANVFKCDLIHGDQFIVHHQLLIPILSQKFCHVKK